MGVNHIRVGWGIIISQTDLGINQQWKFFCGQTADFFLAVIGQDGESDFQPIFCCKSSVEVPKV